MPTPNFGLASVLGANNFGINQNFGWAAQAPTARPQSGPLYQGLPQYSPQMGQPQPPGRQFTPGFYPGGRSSLPMSADNRAELSALGEGANHYTGGHFFAGPATRPGMLEAGALNRANPSGGGWLQRNATNEVNMWARNVANDPSLSQGFNTNLSQLIDQYTSGSQAPGSYGDDLARAAFQYQKQQDYGNYNPTSPTLGTASMSYAGLTSGTGNSAYDYGRAHGWVPDFYGQMVPQQYAQAWQASQAPQGGVAGLSAADAMARAYQKYNNQVSPAEDPTMKARQSYEMANWATLHPALNPDGTPKR